MRLLIPLPWRRAKEPVPTKRDLENRQAMTEREFHRELEIDTLARTIWGEARGEGNIGMQAVAAVVLNRVEHAEKRDGFWWGNDVIAVCQKPYQFSCWNKNDPNYKKLLELDATNLHFATALRIARRALAGVMDDPTDHATHYHAQGIDPSWAEDEKPTAVIGRHLFYRPKEIR